MGLLPGSPGGQCLPALPGHPLLAFPCLPTTCPHVCPFCLPQTPSGAPDNNMGGRAGTGRRRDSPHMPTTPPHTYTSPTSPAPTTPYIPHPYLLSVLLLNRRLDTQGRGHRWRRKTTPAFHALGPAGHLAPTTPTTHHLPHTTHHHATMGIPLLTCSVPLALGHPTYHPGTFHASVFLF